MRTQVGIVGAGPAGLLLSHLLALQGIDSVVLENRSRDYVESRIRAGVLEHDTVETLRETGVGERMDREGIVHHGIELRVEGRGRRIPLTELTGRRIMVYGQQEVVKDLIAKRLADGGTILFEAEATAVDDPEGPEPRVRFTHDGQEHELVCDVVAGCDGFHGVSRPSIPEGAARLRQHDYPFGWLGITAEVPPSTDELIYNWHEHGFALHSLRSPELSRLYIQCPPDDRIEQWSDEAIWRELQIRMAKEGWTLREGPIIEKAITPMRAFVTEPMQYGRLYLAGDAAHIVPPTGAKGLNLAVADVRVLADALTAWYADGRSDLLERYSDTALRRVWKIQHFSTWMTHMLHRFPNDPDGFQARLQRAQLDYVTSSTAAATSLAEFYTGLPTVIRPDEAG